MYLCYWPFNGHGGASMQYKRHRLMRHVQGYTGSHWTPPPGDYSLHVASAATRATAIKTTCTNFDDHFNGHCNVAV
jgi:hypothetical protein